MMGMPGMGGMPGQGMDRDASRGMVQRQVEYYFSAENLAKDMYLRKQMNNEGWVNIHIIAGFNRLRKLLIPPNAAILGAAAAAASDISLLIEALQASPGLELDPSGSAVRAKDIWQSFLLPEAKD